MKFVINRKVLIAMVFTAVTMLGYFSYKQLPVELLPNAQLPYMFVAVSSGTEADPKYMESQAIIPLEGAIGTLKGVEKIESQADQKQGRIRVSFKPGTNVKYAYLKLIAKVDEVKKTLPQGFFVQVVKFDLTQVNNDFMTLQVRGPGGVDRVRQLVNKEIINRLKNINGIANTSVFGGREKSVEVQLREDVCKAHSISPADVRNAISQNSRSRTFAGKLINNQQLVFVNIVSEYTDIRELEEIVISPVGPLKLKDIAEISFGVKEQESYSRVNGKESVTIQLTRDAQSNMIELSNKVKEQIEVLNKDLKSKELEIVIQNNMADTMEKNLGQLMHLAIVGGLLAIFILWVFLRNFRLVVSIALAIPISVYTAYNFFYFYDISINSLTLIGLALAIGMLLDNSVVVMENIYRLASGGYNSDDAVAQGTREVWRSVSAATLCMVAVFLPFAFSSNFVVGVVGKNISVSIISTLIISLVTALLLVPMITHAFLKFSEKGRSVKFENISYHNRLVQVYMVLLKTCMRNPARTIMGIFAAFFLSLLISLGVSLINRQEPEIINLTLYVTMPGGTNLRNTDLTVATIEDRLAKLPEKKEIISQIFEGEAVVTISLLDDYRKVRNLSVPEIKDDIMRKIDMLDVQSFDWSPPSSGGRFGSGGGDGGDFGGLEMANMMGFGPKDEKIIIKGADFGQIVRQADLVKFQLSQLSSIRRSNISLPQRQPHIQLDFDKQLMALYDIQASSVLSELGSFPQEFNSGAVFKQGPDEYGIRIKMVTAAKQEVRDLDDLKKLAVRSRSGSWFELQNISDFTFTNSAPTIKRTNQERQLEVSYAFVQQITDDNDLLQASRQEVDDIVAALKSPTGIVMEVQHESQDLTDFSFLISAALLLIYIILASVFESFSTPIVLMFAIPLAAIGSMLGLIITGNSLFSIFTLTGFIILIGIVVNNGIILIDYSRILQSRGYGPSRALIMAGLARIRPILITAMTTIIALVPMAMGKAEYVEKIGAPFAITVIGGLSLSTLFTLIFIPTQYSGMNAAMQWIWGQKLWVKIAMAALCLVGVYYIATSVESLVWRIIDYILLFILVPSAFYFVQTSLRQATERVIDENAPLRIHVRNLVKIYDRDSRFMREWKSGMRIRERLGLARTYTSLKDFDYLWWKIPILAFGVYFIYFFMESGFWYFVLPVLLYLFVLSIMAPFKTLGSSIEKQNGSKWLGKLTKVGYKLFFWGYPAIALLLFEKRFGLIGLVIPGLLIWYLLLFIKITSDKIYHNKININRIQGRFKGIRKLFYRFVLVIPVIGKKKVPFKALKGVSFTIENGMFGLLGPNGAGKSTLMRIVCGILEPSYGQITINGIDVKKKREELQGLIGYLPQEFGMYENLTAWEFLSYMAILKKLYNAETRKNRIEYVLKAVHMFESKDQKIGSFSGGMKQRIGIAQILLHLPRILVVDEPTAGLDPRERIRFRNLLVDLSRERIVIFSTHIIEDVASSCSSVAVIKGGELKYLGAPVDMARIAQGKVWTVDLDMETFEEFKGKYTIIHHMRDGDKIRVRCMSDNIPAEGAQQVKANLEDAYLCLLGKDNVTMNQ